MTLCSSPCPPEGCRGTGLGFEYSPQPQTLHNSIVLHPFLHRVLNHVPGCLYGPCLEEDANNQIAMKQTPTRQQRNWHGWMLHDLKELKTSVCLEDCMIMLIEFLLFKWCVILYRQSATLLLICLTVIPWLKKNWECIWFSWGFYHKLLMSGRVIAELLSVRARKPRGKTKKALTDVVLQQRVLSFLCLLLGDTAFWVSILLGPFSTKFTFIGARDLDMDFCFRGTHHSSM